MEIAGLGIWDLGLGFLFMSINKNKIYFLTAFINNS
jgi:hypothetical protein